MKKLALLVLILFGGLLNAQNTTVSATVVDSDTTAWAGGTWKIDFLPNPSFPGIGQYKLLNGANLSPTVYSQSGSLDGTGAFSVTVYDSSLISPKGSGWTLSVCPNAASNCGIYTFSTAGGSMNISANLTATIPAPRFNAVAGNFGYSDIEAKITIPVGATYFNVTSQCQRIFQSGAWSCPSSGAASASPPAFSIQAANSLGTNLTSDSNIQINTSTHNVDANSFLGGAPPALDIRNHNFAGGGICDNGVHSIDAAFQATLNALPLKGGVIKIVGAPLACYLANPTLISWPAFTGTVTIKVQGQLRLGNTFNSPVGKSINIIGESGATLSSFQGAGEGSNINLSPLSGTCTGSLGTAPVASPLNASNSIITGNWSSGGTTLTISQSVPDNTLVGTSVLGFNIVAGTLVTANTGTTVTIDTPTSGAGSTRAVVFASPFTPSTTACLAIGNSGSVNTILGNSTGNTITAFPGSLITVGGTTSCAISTISRTSNVVTAVLSSSCHIPTGSPVTITGVVDTTFNGAFNPAGSSPKAFEVTLQDYVLNKLTWRQTAADASSTGGAVAGFNEDTLETTFVTAINGSTVYAPFFRTHPATDVWGVGAIANWGGQVLYKDFSISDNAGTALFISGGSFATKVENVGVSVNSFSSASANYANWPLEINSASFLTFTNDSFLAATQQPWAVRMSFPFNISGAGSGPVVFNKTWVGEGFKMDRGAVGVTLLDVTIQSPTRGIVTIDPTFSNNGNRQQVTIFRTGSNDSPDQMSPCSIYYTTPPTATLTSVYAIIEQSSSAAGVNCVTNDYFIGRVLNFSPTVTPRYGQTISHPGIVGNYSDGVATDGDIRRQQAVTLTPFATANTKTDPTTWSLQSGNCTVTSGILAPDGSLTAGQVTSTSTGATQFLNYSVTPAVGDKILYGGWVYSSTLGKTDTGGGSGTNYAIDTNASIHFTLDNPANSQQSTVAPYESFITDDWWHVNVGLVAIATADGAAGNIRFTGQCDSANTLNYWAPFFIYVPASANVPQREVSRWRTQLSRGFVPPNLPAGVVAVGAASKFYFGNDTNVYRGAAGTLQTDGNFNIGAGKSYQINSVPLFTGNLTDFTNSGATALSSFLQCATVVSGSCTAWAPGIPTGSGTVTSSGVIAANHPSCFSTSTNIVDCTTLASPNFVPIRVAKIDTTGLTANVGNTTAYAVPSSGAGYYSIACYLVLTTAATTSTTFPSCAAIWTDADTGVQALNSTGSANFQLGTSGTTGNTVSRTNISANGANTTVAHVAASSNIQYNTLGYGSVGATPMAYALHFTVTYLGP